MPHGRDSDPAAGGTVVLRALPFTPGLTVEVIVLSRSSNGATESAYPLRGQQPYRYDNPCNPVAADDWEALGWFSSTRT